MMLDNQIKIWNMLAEACEGDESAPFCLQLRDWLIELKERREQAQRETGEFEQMRRNNMFLEMRIGHLLQSKFIRSFDAKEYGTGSYIRDIEDADKLVDKKSSDEIQRGEWVEVKKYNRKGKKFLDCSVCHYGEHGDVVCEVSKLPNFCPACGLPMTDEAVEILKKREAI